MTSEKEQFNARISPHGKRIVHFLQERYGISQAGLLEMLLRDRLKQLELEENVDPTKLRKLGDKR